MVWRAHLFMLLPLRVRKPPVVPALHCIWIVSCSSALAAAFAEWRWRHKLLRTLGIPSRPAASAEGAHLTRARDGLGAQGDGLVCEPQSDAGSRVFWRGRHWPWSNTRILYARFPRASAPGAPPMGRRRPARWSWPTRKATNRQARGRRWTAVCLYAFRALPESCAAGCRRGGCAGSRGAALHLHGSFRCQGHARQQTGRSTSLGAISSINPWA
mmetsp:Transcript_40434/g.100371  ORF Transcript_40434/g.100371 Transcript_40434/m.100371 type:complete len:214 (-) Transcript_40434:1313-1954(-)